MTNYRFCLWAVLAIVVVILSLTIDIIRGEIECFQRSGSIMTLIGAFMSARELIASGIRKAIKSRYVTNGGTYGIENGGAYDTGRNEVEAEATRNVLSTCFGLFLIVVGTAIWGYGDLLMTLVIPT